MTSPQEDILPPSEASSPEAVAAQAYDASMAHAIGAAARTMFSADPHAKADNMDGLNAELQDIGLTVVETAAKPTELQKSIDRLTAMGLPINHDRIAKLAARRFKQRRAL